MRLRLLDAVLLRRDADADTVDDDDEGADAPAERDGELAIVKARRACECKREEPGVVVVASFVSFFYAILCSESDGR